MKVFGAPMRFYPGTLESLGYERVERGGEVIYLSPLEILAEEAIRRDLARRSPSPAVPPESS